MTLDDEGLELLRRVVDSDMAMREEDEGNGSPLLDEIRAYLARPRQPAHDEPGVMGGGFMRDIPPVPRQPAQASGSLSKMQPDSAAYWKERFDLLSEQVQASGEPVAWLWLQDGKPVNAFLHHPDQRDTRYWEGKGFSSAPLYAAPPVAQQSAEPVGVVRVIDSEYGRATVAELHDEMLPAGTKLYAGPVAQQSAEPVGWVAKIENFEPLVVDKSILKEPGIPLYAAPPVDPAKRERARELANSLDDECTCWTWPQGKRDLIGKCVRCEVATILREDYGLEVER